MHGTDLNAGNDYGGYKIITVYILRFKLCEYLLFDLLLFTDLSLTSVSCINILGKMFIVSYKTIERSTFSLSVIKFRWNI